MSASLCVLSNPKQTRFSVAFGLHMFSVYMLVGHLINMSRQNPKPHEPIKLDLWRTKGPSRFKPYEWFQFSSSTECPALFGYLAGHKEAQGRIPEEHRLNKEGRHLISNTWSIPQAPWARKLFRLDMILSECQSVQLANLQTLHCPLKPNSAALSHPCHFPQWMRVKVRWGQF